MIYVENLDSLITCKQGDEVFIRNVDEDGYHLQYKCIATKDLNNVKVKDAVEDGLPPVEVYQKTGANYISENNPPLDFNPIDKGFKWLNIKTGETFVCLNNNEGKNVWKGDNGTIVMPIPPKNKIDILGNGTGVALYPLEGNGNDLGGKYNGHIEGTLKWGVGIDGKCAVATYNGQIQIDNLPFNEDTEAVTVAFWCYWYGRNTQMACGFKSYDLYVYGNYFGFNTANADVYGFDFRPYKHKWVHIVATFKKGQYGKIWLNGEPQTLTQKYGRLNKYGAKMSNQFAIFGWRANRSYRYFGKIDHFRILKGEVTDDQAKLLYNVLAQQGDKQ